MHIILHIDMNAFFAACHIADDPSLKGKPIIVGGDPSKRRGIVLTASYEARKFGIYTTMTIYQAQNLCPNLIIIRPNHILYSNYSKKIMNLLKNYSPLIEQFSIDEAWINVTESQNLFGNPLQIAKTIQNDILNTCRIPSSIGISTNKLLSKIASDMKKPMGITKLYPNEIEEKLWPLPIKDMLWIGKKTESKLNLLGIKTIGDLAHTPKEILTRRFGIRGIELINQAKGIGSDKIILNSKMQPKSIGNEITLSEDIGDINQLKTKLFSLSEKVSRRCRKRNKKARTITIKLKDSNFRVKTRSKTIDHYTNFADEIYQISSKLLEQNSMDIKYRLIGLSLSNFMESNDSQQISFFDKEIKEESNKKENLMKTVDALNEKYGKNIITKGKLLK